MDRYVETIYAHAQLYGLGPEIISGIFEDIYIRPDFYLFLDLDPQICYKRILQRGKAIRTHEELCNLIELYEFYKSIVKTLGVKVIDADKTLSETHQSIVSHIELNYTGELR
jgi:thymidylate kinase